MQNQRGGYLRSLARAVAVAAMSNLPADAGRRFESKEQKESRKAANYAAHGPESRQDMPKHIQAMKLIDANAKRHRKNAKRFFDAKRMGAI